MTQVRPAASPADRARVAAFIENLGGEVAHASVGERKLIGLGRGDPVAVIESGGSIIGALLATPGPLHTIEIATIPGRDDIAEELLAHAMATHSTLRVWSLGDRWGPMLRTAGFSVERTLHRLEVALPVQYTQIHFRETGFKPEYLEAWLEVNNAAFSGHPEQGNWTEAEFNERTRLAWWDPSDLRMAWDGEKLVGFCWTKVHADGVGEIYVIGLRPAYHGRGWGKQLVLEGLRHLAESKGCDRGMLYVDTVNQIALATYERIGFRTTSIDRAYTPGK